MPAKSPASPPLDPYQALSYQQAPKHQDSTEPAAIYSGAWALSASTIKPVKQTAVASARGENLNSRKPKAPAAYPYG